MNILEVSDFLFDAPKRASQREIINLCEVCEKPTDFQCIEVDDGDQFWYCKDHAKREE